MSSSPEPTLWHIPVSHYSEKARWALAHKGVEHNRHAPPPGAHMAIALALTRGAHKTFPVLRLDGRNVGDSTAIIEALELRWPQPRLYPDDPAERRRALELEDYFDEELGPHIRLLAWHELRNDPQSMGEVTATMVPGPIRGLSAAEAVFRVIGSTYVQLRFRVAGDEAAAAARVRVLAALDRLDAELEASGGDYLVGDSFSVADLTAAALFYPLVNPPEGPQTLPGEPPARFEEFRAPLKARPGYKWVERIYREHRKARASYQPSVPGSPL